MSLEERVIYAKLIIALARDDREEIRRLHFEEQGVVTKTNDQQVGYLFSCFYNDRDSPDVCQDMNISSFIDYLEREDPMVRLPDAYIMASRVSIMMRGESARFGLLPNIHMRIISTHNNCFPPRILQKLWTTS
jgi:hypothetical protein